MTVTAQRPGSQQLPARFTEADCRLDDFLALLEQRTDVADYPHAAEVVQDVLVYDAATLRRVAVDDAGRETVQAELVRALTDGPGVVAFRGAFPDTAVVDRATAAFEEIITAERAGGAGGNDHFGSGANDRVWNALEKLAVRDPGTFVDYYGNDLLALVSSAWLGPAYQVTSQVNVVRPGGQAQDPHRDYHLGFLSNETAARYPAHVHLLSPVLTLQGAVAHSDMPVESGPTMYLPYSHQYAPGYLAWRLPEFREHFLRSYVQLPLAKGDAAFFNPALFHGAGTNVSADVQRMANLLQVSSAFGRAMETVDRSKVVRAVYPVLRARRAAGVDAASLANALAASAEGYPFPTNLDLDANVNGLTPLSQAEIVAQALADDVEPDALAETLDTYDVRHRTDEI
ncbi:Ectoine hydroxylase-related dioxygenase, phytanoyl-CoA dioxygenase (PhyH) family [Microlunatus sagamiharensis]|uniref:Ectoine hydroxylase-related dioxygenase, phytanoyl-CoA dioxygenase (PhyH) family n=1 Tax=Microlunatus sagamiharensis TaxID=546874 RepID=A0A1H2LNJ3_9ACTN|nr:phytanoyl-CoA dioxygenase family protein [Microlunatus sagamiharensis]SDU82573.1 Ectoine hydroxylase-related dioxygenase, phytanoyl-CoA dioxygenase (PhyH) family [Microlunatus sagamiharensis]